jgi:hypothetical protein
MSRSILTDIEQRIDQLSRDEQLWLIERLAQCLRQTTPAGAATRGNDLASVATDPEIETELRAIEEELGAVVPEGPKGDRS